MDDLIILDTDLNKLKNAFKLIENKIKELKLNINSKSNIYKLLNGINFLGYVFRINKSNKLIIRYNNTTIKRINRYLKKLKRTNIEKYKKSLSSYKGYLCKSNTKLKKNLMIINIMA